MEFLALPPEIRIPIYNYLLVKPKGECVIIVSAPRNFVPEKDFVDTHLASLLRVNKQINEEAKATYYGCNTFVIGNYFLSCTQHPGFHTLEQLTARVPKDCFQLIRRVQLEI